MGLLVEIDEAHVPITWRVLDEFPSVGVDGVVFEPRLRTTLGNHGAECHISWLTANTEYRFSSSDKFRA